VNQIEEFARYFKDLTGVSFDAQLSILENKLSVFCSKHGVNGVALLLGRVRSDSSLRQLLINALTTNETYFYIEFAQIEVCVKASKSLSSHISILCAPSSTGEEPYSIAMALLEAGVTNFSIVGIDINQQAIDAAKEAVYETMHLRNLNASLVARYFDDRDGRYALKQSVKSKVSFRVANIFDSSFASIGKFDFVFSRNMLIYFDKETKVKARKILEGLLKEGAHDLFFGHADLF
jgi:chemotaxis protein methyltransferase CheR